MKNILSCLFLLTASTVFGQSRFKPVFQKYNAEGSTTVYHRNKMVWFYSDSLDARHKTLPGSTFNIVNAAIALEIGVLKTENDVVKWDGKKQSPAGQNLNEWNKDTELKTAFKNSNTWFFSEVAKRIGHKDYADFLKMCGYGNPIFNSTREDFWNAGDYGVSPVSQINFLRFFATEQLSFSPRTFRIVKDLMNTEKNNNYVLTSQSGLVKEGKKEQYWYIGYIQAKNNIYYFATRINKISTRKSLDFQKAGKEITLTVLKQIGAFN